MDLLSPSAIKGLLSKYNARPSRTMGQNFLIDTAVLDKIVKTAELTPKDIVLEIGPGMGTLTKELAKKSGKIITIEKDRVMVKILKEILKDYLNVEIINGDILKISKFESISNSDYKVVSNIPYYLTSVLIRKFLETENKPGVMVLMVQKEVAQRICSKPPNMSLLAISVQFYAKAEIISYVPKECFWPSPEVDSAILKISNIKDQESIDIKSFFKIVKAGFSQPRKQLVNNLSTLKSLNDVKLDKHKITEWLLRNNIDPSQRAETLSVCDWIKLTGNF